MAPIFPPSPPDVLLSMLRSCSEIRTQNLPFHFLACCLEHPARCILVRGGGLVEGLGWTVEGHFPNMMGTHVLQGFPKKGLPSFWTPPGHLHGKLEGGISPSESFRFFLLCVPILLITPLTKSNCPLSCRQGLGLATRPSLRSTRTTMWLEFMVQVRAQGLGLRVRGF